MLLLVTLAQLAFTSSGDLAGTPMDFLLNTKLTKSLTSKAKTT